MLNKVIQKTIKPIIQFFLILLIGTGIIISTSWIINNFQEPVKCECQCECEHNYQKCNYQERDLIDELYFLWAIDGAVSEPKFVPMFCEIYKQCLTK